MRIIFIENRYSTKLWQVAAQGLAADGHEIHWLIQNKLFSPCCSNIHWIPYPRPNYISPVTFPEHLQSIARTDRALRLFGVENNHYYYYYSKIEKLIDDIVPDLVFGESTQFHELMVIAICKLRGINYLAPNSTRYPIGRLVFLREDTLEPVGGSGETLSEDNVNMMIKQIETRAVQPSYMTPPKRSLSTTAFRVLEQIRIALSWMLGERFITPSPFKRYALDRAQIKAKSKWENIVIERDVVSRVSKLNVDDPWILYPLQLQPESNLDVYGQPWINQAKTLECAAAALAKKGALLVVKPNPKSKYEMNDELVAVVRRNSNIIPLPHVFSMANIFPQAPLVLSVTGTVILECIFTSKPVCVLGSHELARLPGVTSIDTPDSVAEVLALSLAGQAITATREEAHSLLRHLYSTSYDALLWDPIARPDLFVPKELERLRNAFRNVVSSLS